MNHKITLNTVIETVALSKPINGQTGDERAVKRVLEDAFDYNVPIERAALMETLKHVDYPRDSVAQLDPIRTHWQEWDSLPIWRKKLRRLSNRLKQLLP